MISIVVCSINPQLLSAFSKNVQGTIGVPYEIIAIDNTKANEGICKVYNKGAGEAKYDILCFAHEDILFHTNDWGNNLVKTFIEDTSIGLIGACGAKCKSRVPSMWIDVPTEYFVSNAYFPEDIYNKKKKQIKKFDPEVAVLDGLFLATKREIWSKVKFNEDIKGFHFYDIDLSLRVGRSFKVIVSPNIIFEHLSKGKRNKSWVETAIHYHRSYLFLLPKYIGSFSTKEKRKINFFCCLAFFRNLVEFGFSLKLILFYYFLCVYYKPLSRVHFVNAITLINNGNNKCG